MVLLPWIVWRIAKFHLVGKIAKKSGGALTGAEDALELQKKIKQYLSVGRTDNALNWSWHATAALIGASMSNGLELRQGIVGVRTGKQRGAQTFDDQLSAALNSLNGRSYPAIAFSQSGVKKPSNTQRYLSIFNTLGLIANLLELDAKADEDLKKQITDQLNKVRNTPTVSLPNWADLVSIDGDDASDDDDNASPSDSHERSALEQLVEEVERWLQICVQLKVLFHPSAVLLGKIWNRLYFSLDNISSNMRTSRDDVGQERCVKAMELFSWALINACLVEEVDYHYRQDNSTEGAIDRSNPRSSGELVIKKFTASAQGDIDVTPTIAPLTFMIASCPLLLGLIKEGSRGISKKFAMESFIKTLNTKLGAVGIQAALSEQVTCADGTWNIIGATTVSKSGSSVSGKQKPEKAD